MTGATATRTGDPAATVDAWTAGYLAADDAERRLVEAAERCIVRWGIRKTSLDDIARDAGVSRATVYRVFPGGKERVVEGVLCHVVGRFFHELDAELAAAPTLDALLAVGVGALLREAADNPVLPSLLEREPDMVLPHFAFHRFDRIFALADAVRAAPRALPAARRGAPGRGAAGPQRAVVRVPTRRLARPPRRRGRAPPRHHLPRPGPHRPRSRSNLHLLGAPRMSTNEELIGRADVNDLAAILAVSNNDVDEAIHTVQDNAEAIFTWDYEKGRRPALNRLYEKAKTSQWNGETDLPWDTDVDQEAVVMANATANLGGPGRRHRRERHRRHAVRQVGPRGVDPGRRREPELDAVSQFMHGEQGALRVHGQDRRDRAVDRRQVLRVDAGHGRGPPRRGLRQVPRRRSCRATIRSTPT